MMPPRQRSLKKDAAHVTECSALLDVEQCAWLLEAVEVGVWTTTGRGQQMMDNVVIIFVKSVLHN